LVLLIIAYKAFEQAKNIAYRDRKQTFSSPQRGESISDDSAASNLSVQGKLPCA